MRQHEFDKYSEAVDHIAAAIKALSESGMNRCCGSVLALLYVSQCEVASAGKQGEPVPPEGVSHHDMVPTIAQALMWPSSPPKRDPERWIISKDFAIKLAEVTGADLIASERAHQKTKWDAAHDDNHFIGTLSIRAAELIIDGTDESIITEHSHEPDAWGLVAEHRGDRIRSLTIAGALIAAEIDRELRCKGGASDAE